MSAVIGPGYYPSTSSALYQYKSQNGGIFTMGISSMIYEGDSNKTSVSADEDRGLCEFWI